MRWVGRPESITREWVVGDQQFGHSLVLGFVEAVAGIDLFNVELAKQLSNLRHVIDAHNELAFDACQLPSQAREVVLAKQPTAIDIFAIPVRRVEVKQGVFAI